MAHTIQDIPTAELIGDSQIHLTNASGQTMFLPNSLSLRTIGRPRTLPTTELAGQHGAVLTGRRTYRAKTLSIGGSLIGDSFEEARTKLDDLLAFLDSSPIEVRENGATDRYLLCEFEGLSDSRTIRSDPRNITLPLVALDPFYYAHTPTTYNADHANGQQFALTVNGNHEVYPVVSFTGLVGGAVSPQLTNARTGEVLLYADTLNSGGELVMNTERFTAEVGAAGVLGVMGSDFFNGWRLLPGANLITVGAVSGSVNVSLAWRDRWL